MRTGLSFLLAAATLIVGGCVDGDDFGDEPVRAPYVQPGYEVAAGPNDTVETMARRFRISPEELIRANRLRPPYALRPYQPLIIPPPATYRVRDGDTVGAIAASLGVGEIALAQANGLSRPYHMQVGQILRVPGGYGGGAEAIAASEPEFVSPSLPPRSSISAKPLGPPPTAPAITPIAPPRNPNAPPHFLIPPASVSATALAPPPRSPPPAGTAPPVADSSAAPTSIVPINPAVEAKQPSPPAREAVEAPAREAMAPPAGQPHFVRPVGGQIIQPFGSNGSGHSNEGINIAAAAGTPVRAADAGTVIYTGNELAAFGNLVLIRHAGGWVTAYGHLGSIGVKKGAAVSQGQSIGTVGQTGSVTAPQLHFEIRQGSKPVDPAQYLSSSHG